MSNNIISIIIVSLFIGIFLLAAIRILVKAAINKNAAIETAEAVVIDKYIIESFSKYSGNGKREKYVIAFSVGGKKKSFYVSEFSYGGYRINEKGVLKYKGDKIIEWK